MDTSSQSVLAEDVRISVALTEDLAYRWNALPESADLSEYNMVGGWLVLLDATESPECGRAITI